MSRAQVFDENGVTMFEDQDDAYRVALHGSVIEDEGGTTEVDWEFDRRTAVSHLEEAITACDVAAVLAIPGAAETISAMRKLLSQIEERT